MTEEQRKALVALLREHMKLKAEISALSAILTDAKISGECPSDWLENLQELRQSPEYRATAEQLEPQVLEIEQRADDVALIESLKELLTGKPPN
jgi:hypothetical protein